MFGTVLFFVCLLVCFIHRDWLCFWPCMVAVLVHVSYCDAWKDSPNPFYCVSHIWLIQCLWNLLTSSQATTLKLHLLVFSVILQSHSIFSFRCSLQHDFCSDEVEHIIFTCNYVHWDRNHLEARTPSLMFLVVHNMKSTCHYYHIKLYAYDKIINLCILHALVTGSLNGTDYEKSCQMGFGAISLLFLWLAPQTWHSWWP